MVVRRDFIKIMDKVNQDMYQVKRNDYLLYVLFIFFSIKKTICSRDYNSVDINNALLYTGVIV